MPFNDLDEELQALGFGNMWDAQKEELANRKAKSDSEQLERLKEYNRLYPERHLEAIKRWLKNKYHTRKEEVKHRLGVDKCVVCDRVLRLGELIWETKANPMHCVDCKRAKKGKKNE